MFSETHKLKMHKLLVTAKHFPIGLKILVENLCIIQAVILPTFFVILMTVKAINNEKCFVENGRPIIIKLCMFGVTPRTTSSALSIHT